VLSAASGSSRSRSKRPLPYARRAGRIRRPRRSRAGGHEAREPFVALDDERHLGPTGGRGMKSILVIGAHPDDCDFFAGGCAALWRRRGDRVRFVSMTNGDAGHHTMARRALAERRRAEAARAAEVIGIEYVVLHHHDGELLPTLEIRSEVIRMVREFRPDL